MAYWVAKKYQYATDACISYEDILQQAKMGLWVAVSTFDPTRGFQFSTYAMPHVRGAVQRMLRDNYIIHQPRHFKDIRYELVKRDWHLPLTQEQMDELVDTGKFSLKQLMSYVEVTVTSLDVPLSDDSDATLGDLLADESWSPATSLEQHEVEALIEEVLDLVSLKHRDMVEEWLYSVVFDRKLGQMELAKKYGVSQAQVSRILNSTVDLVKMEKGIVGQLI